LKLKCENLEEKVKALQLEVNELTMDIEAMEIDEEIEQPNNGFLGSIFEQFKADPISTVAMVKMMFQNLTDKKESNEQTQTNKTNTAQQGKS
jgi:2-oxoglutarate dehydrogenase complex dehydrogenase (E1) component-like enzyme